MVQVFECPGGCPPGECDTKGAGEEGEYACAVCGGSGVMADDVYGPITCTHCKGDGRGGGYSSVTCSKCGQSALSRAMWEGP
jgi:DNA-directed RNA polymerase subunit RPC12/RpoP